MIAPMDQLLLVGRRGIAHELLIALQKLGVVHIDPLQPKEGQQLSRLRLTGEDRKRKEGWDAVVAKSEGLLTTLAVDEYRVAPARGEVPADLETLIDSLNDLGTQVDQLVAERNEIRDELEVVSSYLPFFRELAPTLAQLEASRFLYGSAFVTTPESFRKVQAGLGEALEERIELSTKPLGKQLLVIAAVPKGDRDRYKAALGRYGLVELELPERYRELGFAKAVHVMEERSLNLPKRLATIEADLSGLGAQHGPRLLAIRQVALNHQSRYQALEDLAEGRYTIALKGWVPRSERDRAIEGVRRQFADDVVVEARPADEHHDASVPVKLDNPGWIKPFEALLSLFEPPRYGGFDPSWTLAIFFPLLFGMIVGDMAFGFMFLALGVWLRRRGAQGKPIDLGFLSIIIPAQILPTIGTVINWCAAWTIVWGFAYGEFFGNLLELWPPGNPIFYPTYSPDYQGLIPIAIFRVHESGFGFVLAASILFGMVQVLGGWAIRAYYGFKHHDRKHLWEGIGMFFGLAALVLFAYGYLTDGLTPLVLTLVAIGMFVFAVGVVLSGVILMPVELVSNAGNILSYLRIFAVGLAAALIATLVTELGFAMSGVLPIVGPILGILVAFVIHLAALLLKIISYTLQPLRLQYVEFFTKFGFYEESGRPYKPFRLIGGKA